MDKKPKRPRDVSQLAKMMVDIAGGEDVEPVPKDKDPAAVKWGRSGGGIKLIGLFARTSNYLMSIPFL